MRFQTSRKIGYKILRFLFPPGTITARWWCAIADADVGIGIIPLARRKYDNIPPATSDPTPTRAILVLGVIYIQTPIWDALYIILSPFA